MIAITNANLFLNNEFLKDYNVYIENGTIKSIDKLKIPEHIKQIDAMGNYLVPGLVDLQIYGSGGNLLSAFPTEETLYKMDLDLHDKGTTGFLACIATNTKEVFDKTIEAAKAYRPRAKGFIGLHLEGPFLNKKRRGAHIESLIRKAGLDEIKQLIENGDGVIKMMTIAPEVQDDSVIQYLLDNGVVLSLGHSDATFEEATLAYRKGITTTTHLFNAMTPIHHRQPGIPTAIFSHDSAMASIIADGNHVDFEVVKMAQKLLEDRLFLITDAVTSCNTGPYQHRLDGDKFVTTDGTLSGSNITMLDAVRNCVNKCGIDLITALKMASVSPAKVIKAGDTLGKIAVGQKANLVLLNEDLNLMRVF